MPGDHAAADRLQAGVLSRVSGHAHPFCRSGLVSRKGCVAAPAIDASTLKSRGRCAPLSRHKAAPTGNVSTLAP
ncbi:hypothetical protein DMX06_16685 [Pseudomonas mosselii]|nr:hypothetical protein DMX06_16685 [Pseudomonas mosselii]